MFLTNILRNSLIFTENLRRSRYLPYFVAWIIAIILAITPIFSNLTTFANENSNIVVYEDEETLQDSTELPTEEITTEPPTDEIFEEETQETEEVSPDPPFVELPEEIEEEEETSPDPPFVEFPDYEEEIEEEEEVSLDPPFVELPDYEEEIEEEEEVSLDPPFIELPDYYDEESNDSEISQEEQTFQDSIMVEEGLLSADYTTVSVAEQINAATGLQVAVSGNVVTVLNQPTSQVYSTLRIDIPQGVIVRWAANYRGEITNGGPLINLVGEGLFEVVDGVWMENISTGNTILSGNVSVHVSGGAVQASTGTAIRVDGETATVTVSGNGSVFTDSNTNLHLAISLTNPANNGLNVIIRDNGSVAALSYQGNGFAIQTYGDVSVSGNAHIFADTGRAINALGESSNVTITGGIVWSGAGMAIHTNGANAAVTVTNAHVYNEGADDSHATIDMSGTGTVTIGENAVIEAQYRGTAIKTAGAVYVQDSAEVTATTGRAIHTTGNGSVTITGGFVFAWGNALASVVDTANFAPPTGDGVVVAWQTTTGQGAYLEMSDLALRSWPDHATDWHSDGTQAGVLFNDNLFFPIRGVTVNFDESNYGLIFNTTDGTFWLDTDNSGTVTPRDIRYRGQTSAWRWASGTRTLSLDNFNWNTSAETALTIVGGDITINLNNRSTFTATTANSGIGIKATAIVTLSGAGELAGNGSQTGIAVDILNLTNGAVIASGANNAIIADITLPGAYIYWQNETPTSPGGAGTEFTTLAQENPFVNTAQTRYAHIQTNAEGVDLLNVAGSDVSHLSNTGTAANPVTTTVNVPNSMADIALHDITFHAATMALYSDNLFSQQIIGLETIPLNEGSITPIYILLTAADGTTAYYAITIQRAEGVRFSIMFDATGGEVSSDLLQTEPTSPVLSTLPIATRTGYNFVGWFTQSDNGEQITADTLFTSHIIVYAHWENAWEEPVEPVEEPIEEEIEPIEEEIEPSEPAEPIEEEIEPVEPTEPIEEEIEPIEPTEPIEEEIEPSEPAEPTEEEIEPIEPAEPIEEEIDPTPQITPVIHNTNASIPQEYNNIIATGDTAISFHPGSFNLVEVQANGETLQRGTDYATNNNQIILLETFFARYTITEFHITFVMDGGTNPHFVVIAPQIPIANEVTVLLHNTSAEQWQTEPNLSTTRGTVVTVLYRMAGNPDITGLQNPFNDVYEGRYYTNAVRWGAFNHIILGYGNDNYGPEDNVTREQLAAILFRYTNFMQLNLGTTANVTFSDYSEIYEYARPAVTALTQAGIIYGRENGMFDPHAEITIGELATILERFTDRFNE
ncbi:MAG: S-layer homology domain-containing protein [Firmicutes bacterium]|nr:S-layer homology domain-containing protein [Bacillota bacterium]